MYTKQTNKTLKPTKYWSENWPADSAISALCMDKVLIITPFCYEDETDLFISSDDSNYVEVILPEPQAMNNSY